MSQHKCFVLYGEPERVRTSDPRLRRPVLYPTELLTHFLTPNYNNTFEKGMQTPMNNKKLNIVKAVANDLSGAAIMAGCFYGLILLGLFI